MADKDVIQKKPAEVKKPQRRPHQSSATPISGNPKAHDYEAWGGVEREKDGHLHYRV